MLPQNINKEKYAKNKAEHDKSQVTDDTGVKDLNYFNLFECRKNLLNRRDATCEQACMATLRDKYYTGFFRTITYCNNCNNASFSNEKTRYSVHRVIAEEEVDAQNITLDSHNVAVDTFSHTSNTQIENENIILTSDKQDKLDALAEMLKALTINYAVYY